MDINVGSDHKYYESRDKRTHRGLLGIKKKTDFFLIEQ